MKLSGRLCPNVFALLAVMLAVFVMKQADAATSRSVAFLGVQFLNNHAEFAPTTDAERARLMLLKEIFHTELNNSGAYSLVPISPALEAKIEAGQWPGECGGCEYAYGEEAGADLVAWIVVEKVSTLILNLNVYMADVANREMAFVRSVDIRGNTDETWTRGLRYLLRNYLLASDL
jgi:hypothetical protein